MFETVDLFSTHCYGYGYPALQLFDDIQYYQSAYTLTHTHAYIVCVYSMQPLLSHSVYAITFKLRQ